ncbi:MAG: hypothetical protein LBR37_00775 [Erysipelotrichaceae bacterium]|jgi:hypothetical protein|nr:hypothetical protein [Erysipelotrichaceae bacterium]
MIKYLYFLKYVIFYRYDHEDNENVEEIFPVGFFSSKKKTLGAIDECLEFKGTNKEYFQIEKFRIEFNESLKKIYFVQHEFAIYRENGDIIDYHYYFTPKATENEAIALCEKMKKKRKYKYNENRDYSTYPPDGFIIDDWTIDKNYFHGF